MMDFIRNRWDIHNDSPMVYCHWGIHISFVWSNIDVSNTKSDKGENISLTGTTSCKIACY